LSDDSPGNALMAWLPPQPPVVLSQPERDRLAALTIGEPAGLSWVATAYLLAAAADAPAFGEPMNLLRAGRVITSGGARDQ
jgi:hypothetical protein